MEFDAFRHFVRATHLLGENTKSRYENFLESILTSVQRCKAQHKRDTVHYLLFLHHYVVDDVHARLANSKSELPAFDRSIDRSASQRSINKKKKVEEEGEEKSMK